MRLRGEMHGRVIVVAKQKALPGQRFAIHAVDVNYNQ
jgi:hypothetical protein